jgi:AraC-like DNA-binding protein
VPNLLYLLRMESRKTYYQEQMEKVAGQVKFAEYQYIQVRQSKHFMEKFYADKIELDKIAMAACMSRFHFIRVFQSIYGITPRQFLKDVRINKAKTLLKKGVAVTTVCCEVGYDSLPTFSTAFKKGTGMSPGKYQQSYNSNPR